MTAWDEEGIDIILSLRVRAGGGGVMMRPTPPPFCLPLTHRREMDQPNHEVAQ